MTIDKQLIEKYAEKIRRLRLIDDDFMKIAFDNNIPATELLLNVFLDRDDMKVLSVTAEREVKNPQGRSVRFDIFAVDSTGKRYDIEMQRSDKGAGVKRARFNSSLLDSSMLESGQDVEELCDSYVIFITENDVRGLGKAIYRFVRRDAETGEPLCDGSNIIYVNGSYRNEYDSIGRLMHDLRCTDAKDMHNSVLADTVRSFKESEGGNQNMCKIFEEVKNEGRLEGEENKLLEQITKKIKKGISVENIADAL